VGAGALVAAALVFVVFVDAAAAVEVLEPLDPVITKYFILPSRCSPSHNHFTPFINEIRAAKTRRRQEGKAPGHCNSPELTHFWSLHLAPPEQSASPEHASAVYIK
jgi:hypothetical protein